MRQPVDQVYLHFSGNAVGGYTVDWVSGIVVASRFLVALAWGLLMVRELPAYQRCQGGGGRLRGPDRLRWN